MLLYPGNDLEEAQARTALRQALLSGETRRLALSRPGLHLELVLVPLQDADGAEIGGAGLVLEREAATERKTEAAGEVQTAAGDSPVPALPDHPTPAPPAAAEDTLQSDLAHALALKQLRVEYQPVIAVATGQIQGLEALLRWAHPTHGVLTAAKFLPFAEASGMIVPIGRWLLEEAARDFRRCVHFAEGLKLHLNLSKQQLHSPGLLDDFDGILAHRGLAPQSIVLEIAESTLQDEQSGPRIAELHARGFGLAVDDFGTGNCTPDSLFRFPFDSLKIDRTLLGSAPEARPLVRSIVALARESKAQTIAEGVETEEQLAFLRDLGCPAAQGFYLSPPVDAEEARALLARSASPARTA
jgi:EAL domain-containing protein (putative c-di-GMP-specific phosphodiesterase class I)